MNEVSIKTDGNKTRVAIDNVEITNLRYVEFYHSAGIGELPVVKIEFYPRKVNLEKETKE